MNYIDSETAEYFRQSSDIYSSGCSLMKSVNLQANEAANSNTILRVSTMLYSMVCYLIGVVALVYLILFIADLFVPITINRGAGNSPELTGIAAVFWNISVVMIWGLQHTIMARPAFKRIWTKVVPVSIERSTYLVGVAIATMLLTILWIPMPAVLWDTSGTVVAMLLIGIYYFGWCITLFSTFLINHFHLLVYSKHSFICDDFSPNKKHLELRCCTNWFGTR